jgi:predicted PurR-regulated permease PerM
VPQLIAQLFFTLILLFFLLASGDMFYEKIVHVMPTWSDKRLAMRIAHDIERKLSHYLSTITFINAGLGVAVGSAMWLLGMPNPILFGVLAFALNFIPYVGALAGVILALVVGIVSLPNVYDAVLVAAVYLLLTSLEGQIVTPHLVGRRLRLNTVVVFVSITLFAWLWSVVGMLVAMPLLLALRTFCEHIPSLNAARRLPVGARRGARETGTSAGKPTRRGAGSSIRWTARQISCTASPTGPSRSRSSTRARLVAAVVYDPAKDEMFVAEKGAWRLSQ